MKFFITFVTILAIFMFGCDPQSDSPKKNTTSEGEHGHHHHEGAHGGNVIDSGGTLHVEIVHNKEEQTLRLYILGADGKTPLQLTEPPIVKLKTADNAVQIKTKPMTGNNSAFEATGSALKDALQGRIAINFEGKSYNLDIETSHDHEGHGHDHPDQAISHTAWTKQCEWFVELETPEAGKPAAFAAHVTLLKDFSPARKGSFTAKATSGSQTATAQSPQPARDGIYTPQITFPQAGQWTLQLTYKSDDVTDTIEYQIEVYEPGKIPHEDEEESDAISFLKEQQWKIPFATAWSKDNKVPNSAIVEENGKSYVYVQLDGESFEKRAVTVSQKQQDWSTVTGLEGKERVVTKGAASIK